MPAMAVSTLELISPISTRVWCEASRSIRRVLKAKNSMKGSTANTMQVSSRLIRARIKKEPASITTERKRFSGPWCASSETSCRSLIMRLISVPVLFSSKKEKGSRCSRRNISRRISACIRTPTTCPQYWMTKLKNALSR